MNQAHLVRGRAGRAEVLVRPQLRERLAPLLAAVAESWPPVVADAAIEPLPGGRGATVLVALGSERFVVRAGRRGGLPGRLLSQSYFGCSARSFREARLIATLDSRGVPVPEVCAAVAVWRLPGVYRNWLVTRWIPEARTLVDWAASEPDAESRRLGFAAVGVAIARLHAAGARHPDLNATNILLSGPPSAPVVTLIDFDGAQLSARAARRGHGDLARLRRSLRKLDPGARLVSAAEFSIVVERWRASSA